MKYLLNSILVFALIFAATPAFSQKNAEAEIKTSAQCGDCKDRIEKAMAYEKGVKKFNLDVKSQMLSVSYDPKKTDLNKIRAAVNSVGYDADSLMADPKAYKALPDCCKKDQTVH